MLKRLERSSSSTQWLILGLALLTLGSALGIDLYREHDRIGSRERERLLTQARVIQENVEWNLAAVGKALANLRRDLPRHIAAGDMSDDIRALTDAMPGVRTLLVLDRNGTVTASNRQELVAKNFAYRDYFKVPRQNPDIDALFVSPPFTSTLGIYGINVSRTIKGPRGEFAGIVAVTLDPEYFRTLMGSVLYAPDMWVGIAHGDGIHFIMVPDREGMTGKNLAQPNSFFSRHRDSGKDANVMTGIVYATGEERMMAMRSIRLKEPRQDKPLVVAVGRDLAEIYAPWRRDAQIKGGLIALIALIAAGGLLSLQGRQREFARKERDAATAVADSEWKLKTIIEAEPECVKLLALDGTLLQMNRAGLEMIEADTEAQVVGHKVIDLVAPEFRDAFTALNERVARGESGTLEFEIIGLRGGRRWLATHAVPMRDVEGRITGVLGVTRDATEQRKVEHELEQLAQTDSLTGLANRRHFLLLAEQELSRTLRYGGPLSVLMMDIDHFKSVNDTRGHKAGDLVLQMLGALCRATLRDIDIVGRLGGEEFGVVLPQTDREQAVEAGERLRQAMADAEVPLDRGLPLRFTVSIGVAALAGATKNIDTLLSEADQALYCAKKAGRNRVCSRPAPGCVSAPPDATKM